jgi:Site-specific recombinases, DNA invertase Pin homologs
MIYGYARVSTKDQNLNLQLDALTKYGVDEIYEEKASTRKADRVVLNELISHLRAGDTLVVWKLDRLGRTVSQLISLAEHFETKGITFVSLQDQFDTSSAVGRAVFHILCVMAQMERDIIKERTMAGLESARQRGVKSGKKPTAKKTVDTALKMYYSYEFSIDDILKATGISKATLYKYIREHKNEMGALEKNGK